VGPVPDEERPDDDATDPIADPGDGTGQAEPGADPPVGAPGTGPSGSTRRQAPASRRKVEAEPPRTALSPRVEAWRKRSATGAILTGFAFGLREALEPERKEPAIVMETSGDPPGDLPVEAHLEDALRPRESVVHIRPWLLDDGTVDAAATPEATGDGRAAGPDDRVDDPDDPAGGNPADN